MEQPAWSANVPPAPAIRLPDILLDRCCLRARWFGSVRVAEPPVLLLLPEAPAPDPGVGVLAVAVDGSGVLKERVGG